MSPIYQNPARPISERVHDLLGRMTLDEKLAQLHAFWLALSEDGNHRPREDAFAGASDPEQVRRSLKHGLGQISRPMGSRSIEPREGARALNALQRFLVEETRLGIPAMTHEECLVGLMCRGGTLFPSALSYGATWNPALIEKAATMIGVEARSLGCHHGLAPVLDVSRDVRWGRTEETFGEDPYLAGVMATRYVRGLQGPKRDLLATLKHYVGHSASEGGRNHAPVSIGWRELNDVFMLPFEMAVKQANPGSVMPAYHDIDGEPVHASRHLLTEVLREQWGFDGLIVADYAGVSLLYQHHGVAADAAEAAAQAFNAGLDIELPGDDCVPHLRTALERGQITVAKIDEVVSRVLTEKFRLGLFEKPYVDEEAIVLQSPEAVATSLDVARQSVVVLENRGVLPLAPQTQRIAVIGPTAHDPLALLGGYSFPVHVIMNDQSESTGHIVTPLTALRARFGAERIHYTQGCAILDQRSAGAPMFPGDVSAAVTSERKSGLSTRTEGLAAAAACARNAEVALVFVGDLAGLFQTGTVGEGSDAASLELPGLQQQLLQAVVDTGTPTVVVLTGGRPYNLGGLEDRVAAQVMAFAGGQEGGTAIADVLSGAVAPSGKLTLSVPRHAGAMPYYYNHKMKSAGTPIALHFGSRYPFGHGLSYTRFEYSDLQVEAAEVDIEQGDVALSFSLRNVGDRAGTEVIQLYVRDQLATVVRPVKELKGFGRVELKAGQRARVRLRVPVDMLNLTAMSSRRVVEPGVFELQVGASSADIRLSGEVRLVGDLRILGRDWRMESRCEVSLID